VVGDRVGRPRGGYSRGEIRLACGARRLLLLLPVDTVAARVRLPLLSFRFRHAGSSDLSVHISMARTRVWRLTVTGHYLVMSLPFLICSGLGSVCVSCETCVCLFHGLPILWCQ
jgi:hypothetical protein